MTASTETSVDEGSGFRRPPAWWHRHLEPEERRRIMADLAVSPSAGWTLRFTLMLSLSVIVAVMGLELNSAAVVIGAMLLAPLMQPVLAAGACLSTALFRKTLVSLARVVAASAWSIGVAYVIAMLLPDVALTNEVLARTQPDIKDLVVALAAGVAGAYATVRPDASAALPGVAVAVALVPPLGSVGIAFEAGESQLAQGALLLYVTNLVAIIFASIVVFIVTGFVAPRRLSDNVFQLSGASLTALAIIGVIAVPLYRESLSTIDEANRRQTAEQLVEQWLEINPGLQLDSTVSIDETKKQLRVEVRGFDRPPEENLLLPSLQQEFPEFNLSVQWIRPLAATTTTLPPPQESDKLLANVEAAVNEWKDAADQEFQIDRIDLSDSVVRIDAAGTGDRGPDLGPLNASLKAIDEALTPVLNWVELETFTPTTMPSNEVLLADTMYRELEVWSSGEELIVTDFAFDTTNGNLVTVELTGAEEPSATEVLEVLTEASGLEDVELQAYFVARTPLTTTTAPRRVPFE